MVKFEVTERILDFIEIYFWNLFIESQLTNIVFDPDQGSLLRDSIFFVRNNTTVRTHKLLKREICAAVVCDRSDFLYWTLLKNPLFLLKCIVSWLGILFFLIPMFFIVAIIIGLDSFCEAIRQKLSGEVEDKKCQ